MPAIPGTSLDHALFLTSRRGAFQAWFSRHHFFEWSHQYRWSHRTARHTGSAWVLHMTRA